MRCCTVCKKISNKENGPFSCAPNSLRNHFKNFLKFFFLLLFFSQLFLTSSVHLNKNKMAVFCCRDDATYYEFTLFGTV